VSVLRVVDEPPDDVSLFGESAVEDLAGYLTAVETFVRRFIAFPSEHEAVAIACWTAHAHLVDLFDTSPILAVTSAEMRSGKTRTLDCLELLTPHPFRVVIPSEAIVYTVLAQRLLRDRLRGCLGEVRPSLTRTNRS
jgi:hypothetical protein